MSYIHCPYGNYYELSESLKYLFDDLVIQPFVQELPALAEDVRNIRPDYWNDIARILKQGQSNFDSPSFDELSNKWYFPKDKVLLYCAHYMPMHLFSSHHIFRYHIPPISDKVVFIDFGCGPLTSGIAFRAFAKQNDIIYLGIDSSQTMLDKAREINQYACQQISNPYFKTFETARDYNELTTLLEKHIGKDDKTQIIFNFCYFFASPTLDINGLSDVLISIIEQYSQNKIYLVYQNPDHQSLYAGLRERLYVKWKTLKTDLSEFRSQVTQSNSVTFSYSRLLNDSLHNADVYYEILC